MPTCRVVIACIPEHQSTNTGLDLARLLAAMGHHVTFAGIYYSVQRKHVEANGFDYCGIGPDFDVLQQEFQKNNFIERLRTVRNFTRALNKAIDEFTAEGNYNYQLAFIDVMAGGNAARFLAKAGIPALVFCSGYTSKFSLRYPPAAWCPRVPRKLDAQPWTDRLANLYWWSGALLMQGLLALSYFVYAPQMLVMEWQSRRQAKKYGWSFCYGDWGIRPRLQEVAFAYQPMDWPGHDPNTRLYICGRHSRKDADGEEWLTSLDSKKPLIYCSFGALIARRQIWKDPQKKVLHGHSRPVLRHLNVVIQAFADRPDWQLILAAGTLAEAIDPDTLPKNVHLYQWLPQDSVLARAALAITPGGSATIRDCLNFGVPMLIFPMWSDHFGNAARVAYHKLGIHGGDIRKLTPAKLQSLIAAVLGDQDIAASVLAAKRYCEADLETQPNELRRFVLRHTSVAL